MDANAKLAAAAEQGMLPLRDLWETLEPDLRKTLRAALDRLHKPRAEAVDRAKQELADGRA